MTPAIDERLIRDSLSRLSAQAGRELLSKEPHWGDAILCDGLLYAARALGSDAPAADALKWFEPKLAAGPDTGGWFWMWSTEALGALGLYLRSRRREYLDYARVIVDHAEQGTPCTADDAPIPHWPAVEVWVDVAYFVAPAKAMLGRIEGGAGRLERALDQISVHFKYLDDSASGLLWHVAYPLTNTHSPCLWARGNSWFSIAASQVLGELRTAGHEERLKDKALSVARALANQLGAAAALQDETGLWHTVLDRPDSYLESSATAGFALALGRALRLKLEHLDAARARKSYALALSAILSKINCDGEFTGVSQETPPGDFAHYQSIPTGRAPFGTGVCMMALAEALGGPL